DAVELPVFLLDGNGRVRRANVAARRLAGALAERLINRGPEPQDAIEPWTTAARLARQVAADRRPRTVEVGRVDIELALPDDLPLLDLDPHRMGQVFQNLLQNAIQHTPPGG